MRSRDAGVAPRGGELKGMDTSAMEKKQGLLPSRFIGTGLQGFDTVKYINFIPWQDLPTICVHSSFREFFFP
jgi:hypothetical protein